MNNLFNSLNRIVANGDSVSIPYELMETLVSLFMLFSVFALCLLLMECIGYINRLLEKAIDKYKVKHSKEKELDK